MGVEVTLVDSAAIVTMRWPEKRNALAPEDAEAVAAAIRQAAATAKHAVVLTGEGAFCSGGDLRAFAEVSRSSTIGEIRSHVYNRVQDIIRALRECPMPTISAIDGPAIGLGFDLAIACDMCFVGTEGWLQQGWAKAGLIAAGGGVAFLEHAHPGLVWTLICEQAKVDAQSGVRLGICEEAEGTGLDAALLRAAQLSAVRRDALQGYAALVREARWPSEEHLNRAADLQAQLIGSEQFRAFAERMLGKE